MSSSRGSVRDVADHLTPGLGEGRGDPGRWEFIARRMALHEQARACRQHSIRVVGNPGDRDELVAATPGERPGAARPLAIVSTERERLS